MGYSIFFKNGAEIRENQERISNICFCLLISLKDRRIAFNRTT